MNDSSPASLPAVPANPIRKVKLADAVVQRVVELEYTPPEDFPDNMVMCTTDELKQIVEEEASAFASDSPPDLKKLLDELVNQSVRLESCECESMPCEHAVKYRAARSHLENLFLEQQREIERLPASRSPTADPQSEK